MVHPDKASTDRTCSCRINTNYIPLKLLYLFFIGGQSCATTYRSLFMRHLGMSTQQTGVIWAFERVVSVIIPPFIGALSDKSRHPKAVLITLFLVGAVTLSSMYFVPQEESLNLTNSNVSASENVTAATHVDIEEYGQTFWLLVVLVFASSFSVVGIYPVLESTVLGVLGPQNRYKFGHQRLWASVGYGGAALIVGYLKDRSAESIGDMTGTNRAFLSMFAGVMVCYCCAAIVSAKLPVRVKRDHEGFRFQDLKIFLKKPDACAFLGLLFFYGIDSAILEIYLFWLAEVKFETPSFILGASTFIGAALDIPFCLAAGYLTKRFGHKTLLCFGLGVMALRTFLSAIVVNAWQLVATESLRGITWGLMFVVICSYTSKLSPKGLEASCMGIMQAFLFGIAYSVGALAGGAIFNLMGGEFLFILCGSATFVATVAFGMFSFLVKKKPYEMKDPGDCTSSLAFGKEVAESSADVL